MIVALAFLLGCWVYSALAIVAALRYRSQAPAVSREVSFPISILKPLAGADFELEENLRSYFEQDYEWFEIIFAVRSMDDLAAPIVRRLQSDYPSVRSRLIAAGDAPYPHDKVFKLQTMLGMSKHGIVVMSDSDVRVGPDFCQVIASEFADAELGLITCPYRAIAGKSFWSRLEGLSMNTDFHSGLFTAVMLEGTKFAVGPTMVARKQLLLDLGGLERVKDYLSSEDFMLGRLAAESGSKVGLSSYIVEHRIGNETMSQNFEHRLRWARTTRRSRPLGYIGQIFTYPAAAVIAICFTGSLWAPLLAVTAGLRILCAWIVSKYVLGAAVSWQLLPAQDLLTFAFWTAGFFGNEVSWRGRRYVLNRDGTLESRTDQTLA